MRNLLLIALLVLASGARAAEIQDLTELAAAPASGDLLVVVDVSDSTDDAAGTGKRITVANLLAYTGAIGGNAATATALTAGQKTLTYDDASTNTVIVPLTLTRTTTGTAAIGIGSATDYILENAAGTNRTFARAGPVATDVTNGSEDGDWVVSTMIGGTLTEVLRVSTTSNKPLITSGGGNSATMYLNNPFNGDMTFGHNGSKNVTLDHNSQGVTAQSDYYFGLTSSATDSQATVDTKWHRNAAGVWRCADDTAGSIRCLQGGGAAVASATALPVPTGRVFHVTGTTTITSITSTNFESGACVTMIFDGVLTLTDGNNIKAAGDFVTTADDTWSACFDGTNWYETARAVN